MCFWSDRGTLQRLQLITFPPLICLKCLRPKCLLRSPGVLKGCMRCASGSLSLSRQRKHTFSLFSLYTETLAASSASSSYSSWGLTGGAAFLLRPAVQIGFIPPSSMPQYRVTARMALLRLSISSSMMVPGLDKTESASSP